MRRFMILVTCVVGILAWCCGKARPYREPLPSSPLGLRYFKDRRTGLCFATARSILYSSETGNRRAGVAGYLAHVPCGPVVKAGLVGE